MKESKFISKNIDKWKSLSEDISDKSLSKKPEKMSSDFLQLNDDFSFAKTYYPSRTIRGILNDFTAHLNLKFQQNRFRRKGIKYFFDTQLPYRLYMGRKPLQLSLFVFLLCMIIGALSASQEPNLEFVRQILGDGYVDMTLENIKKGDPMYVYKDFDPFTMQVYITFNNLYVALISFILGITGGLGSLFVLLKNGVMVGAFQFMFIKEGLFRESFLAIWMHGSTEIPAIIISGGAGFILAKGIFFPGHHSRIKSFQKSAREATTIFLGMIPLILFAGFVESFFTRLTMLPDFLRFSFIIACFFFTAYYFFILPYLKNRNGAFDGLEEEELGKSPSFLIQFYKAKKGPEVFADAISLYMRNWTSYILVSIIGSLFICAGIFIKVFKSQPEDFIEVDSFNFFWDSIDRYFQNIDTHFNIFQESLAPVCFILSLLVSIGLVYRNVSKLEQKASNDIKGVFIVQNTTLRNLLTIIFLFIALGGFFVAYQMIPMMPVKLLFFLPILICLGFGLYKTGSFDGFGLGFKAMFQSFGPYLGHVGLLLLVGGIGLMGVTAIADLIVLFAKEVSDPLSVLALYAEEVSEYFFIHLYLINFTIILSLGCCQLIYVFKDRKEGLSLIKGLEKFGTQENIKGLIRE